MSDLTIAIPFFNARKWLPAALRSVFAQTEPGWRLLLVDDGSTDGSTELLRPITDARVSLWSDGRNRGLSVRLNQIAQQTTTPFLARMDADDLMHPDRIARQLAFLRAHPEVDLVCTPMVVVDHENAPVGLRYPATPPFTAGAALRRSVLTHPTVAGRTEWFRRHPYDESMRRAEDQELWFRSLPDTRFAVLDEPLYFYRDFGIPACHKYAASCREVRRLCLRRGPAAVGWAKTAGLIVHSWCRQTIFWSATRTGCEHWIMARRNRPLNEQQWQSARQALARIRTALVPGLPATESPCLLPCS